MRTRELQRRIERLNEKMNAGQYLCLATQQEDGSLTINTANGALRFANVGEMNEWAEAVGLDSPIIVLDLW